MAFPRFPKSRFYSIGADGRGTLNTAALWNDLGARSEFIRRQSRACGWAHGLSAGVVVASGAARFDLARFRLPPIGRADPVLRVYLVLDVTSGSADYAATLFRQGLRESSNGDESAVSSAQSIPFGPWHNASDDSPAGATLSASGTYWADLDLAGRSFDPDAGIYDVGLVATATAAVNHSVRSVSVIAKPTETLDDKPVSPAWLRCATAYAARADRSDNVAYLARLRDQQQIPAARDPRVLALHCFGGKLTVANASGAYDFDARDFVISRGHDAGDVTLAVYIASNANGITVALGRADTMTFNSALGILSDAMASQSFASGTTGWQTISVPAAEWTANDYVALRLLAHQNNDETSAGTITAFALYEDERAEADYVASDSTMPSGYVEQPAFRAGNPIVASWAAGSQARRDDRKTTADNVQWLAWRNAQCLAQDFLDAPTAAAGTSDAFGTVLWRGRHVTGQGATSLSVAPQIYCSTPPVGRRAKVGLYLDGTLVAEQRLGAFRAPAWGELFASVAAGTAYALEIRAGWTDDAGNPATPGGSEKVYLTGVMLRESR